MMYRAVTWRALEGGLDLGNGYALAALARSMHFQIDDNSLRLIVEDITDIGVLRTPAVDAAVSQVSAHTEVRAELVQRQRALASGRCIIMMGRDIGTVVLPRAAIKLWITASPAERARRRLGEGFVNRDDVDAEQMVQEIVRRDTIDSTRSVSPLVQAADALVIMTDGVSEQAVVEAALAAVRDAVRSTRGA
jgi:cytidylate kinase